MIRVLCVVLDKCYRTRKMSAITKRDLTLVAKWHGESRDACSLMTEAGVTYLIEFHICEEERQSLTYGANERCKYVFTYPHVALQLRIVTSEVPFTFRMAPFAMLISGNVTPNGRNAGINGPKMHFNAR